MIMGQVTFVFSPKVMLLYVVLAWKCYKPICTWMTWTVWVCVALALRCALHSAAQEQEAAIHELKGNTALVPGRDSELTRSEMSSANSFKNSHLETHTFPSPIAPPLYPLQVPAGRGAQLRLQAPRSAARCPPPNRPAPRHHSAPWRSHSGAGREAAGRPPSLPGRTSAARRVLRRAARGCVAMLLRPRLSNTWAWLWKRRSVNKRS